MIGMNQPISSGASIQGIDPSMMSNGAMPDAGGMPMDPSAIPMSNVTNFGPVAAASTNVTQSDNVAISQEAKDTYNAAAAGNSTSSGSPTAALGTGDTTSMLMTMFMQMMNQMMSTSAAASSASSGGSSGSSGVSGGAGPDGGMPTTGDPANNVAQYMSGFKYQFYYNDKKSNAQTIASKSGNCKDLADVAIEKFNQQGIKAQLILGDVKTSGYNGGHYWIKYQDPTSGQMKFFDPTAAASNHSAQRAFLGLHGTYSGGSVKG